MKERHPWLPEEDLDSVGRSQRKYDHILETFVEKLVKEQPPGRASMPSPNGGTAPLPPWMAAAPPPPPPPSVALTLSSPPGPAIPWPPATASGGAVPVLLELGECWKEVEEGHKAWASHRKEAAWRLKRVELQLEAEKASRRREKAEEVEAKVRALRDEEKAVLDRIEAEYREQLAVLRREAELKEQKLAEQWAAKHARLANFMEQAGIRPTGR